MESFLVFLILPFLIACTLPFCALPFSLPSDYKITRDINITHHEKWVPDEIGRNANRDILAAHGMKVKKLAKYDGLTYAALRLFSRVVLGNSPEVVRARYAR